MSTAETVPTGVDLRPLGWEVLRSQFDIPEGAHQDISLNPALRISLKAVHKVFSDGASREVLAVASGERMPANRYLVHNYRIVDGILTEALTTDTDSKSANQDIEKARLADAEVGLSIPTDDDAAELLDLLTKASEEK